MIRKRLPIWTLVLSLMGSALSPIGTYAATREPVKDNGTGLVMSTNPLANKVGKEVLYKGGNAIDAAVAVGYMLAVVHPAAGNIGGGGFALIHTEDGKDVALDFRETAPAKATRDMYLDKKGNVIDGMSVTGYKAAGIPGTVKGMSEMLNEYGTMQLSELIQPAIDTARNGFKLSSRQAETFVEEKDRMQKFEATKNISIKQMEILIKKEKF